MKCSQSALSRSECLKLVLPCSKKLKRTDSVVLILSSANISVAVALASRHDWYPWVGDCCSTTLGYEYICSPLANH